MNKYLEVCILFILGALVLVTLDLAIIFTYFIIIIISFKYKKFFDGVALPFFVSFIFLYPNIADSIIPEINGKQFLLSLISIVLLILFRPWQKNKLYLGKSFNFLLRSWLIWGTFVYLIVFAAYILYETSTFNLMDLFGYPPAKTSHIKVFMINIPMALIVFVPLVSMNRKINFKHLWNLYLILLAINVIYSLINYWFGLTIIESNYIDRFANENRLYSFSYFDPIGFGRMISFPLLLLFSYFVISKSKKSFSLLHILLFGGSILTILLTWSRTTWVSTTVSILMVLFIMARSLKVKNALFMVLITVGLIYFSNPMDSIESSSRLSNSEGSWGARVYKHQIALGFMEKNPLFGAFPGQMIYLSKTIGNETDRSAHSLYLQTGVDFGVPALIIISSILIYTISLGIRLLKKHKELLRNNDYLYLEIFIVSCTAHAIGMVIHGIPEVINMFFIFLNLGFLLAAKRLLIKDSNSKHTPAL